MAPSLRKALTLFGTGYARYSQAALARPKLWALWLALLCTPAVILDAQFFSRVRTGLQDLLPADAPSVRAIDELHNRIGGQSHMTVIAHSDDPASNRAFITRLGSQIEGQHLPSVKSVQWNVRTERDWYADHGALFLPKADFDALADVLDDQVHVEKQASNPLALDLGEPGDDAPKADRSALQQRWHDLEQRLSAQAKSKDRFPNGFLESADGKLVVMIIWLEGSDLELTPAEQLEKAVDADIATLHPEFPGVQTAYNGEVPNIIEEHSAILADLSLSSVLVFFLVGALIVLYFRSLRAVLTVVFALLPGLAFTFAIGRLTVGSLNSNSAFLGSIIAGNGINYPLLLLAYFRMNPRRMDRARAYRLAAWHALPGTFGAAATASAAYGGLAAAHFRGFSDFGWIGGMGMLTTWLMTFATMPIAIGLFNPPRRPEKDEAATIFAARFYESVNAPRIGAALFVTLAIVLSVIGVRAGLQGGLYEMNINALRNRQSFETGSASWDGKMNDIFGIWLTPIVGLSADPAQRETAASALHDALVPNRLAEQVETIENRVPPIAEQERRLAKLRRAKRLLAGVQATDIPADAKPYMDRWLADRDLQPLKVSDVPPSLLRGFGEVDGRTDRTMLIYPSLANNYNDARNVMRFSDALEGATLPPGTVVGGTFLFMAEIIKLVQDEVPKVILAVCLLVALALVPIFLRRLIRIPISVLTVAAVAFSAQAIMLSFGVRVNMFNFAAIPITIGVGSDYLVNLFGAMDAFGTDARHAAARMGGAILLCSLTTVVGYLSLVFAQSGALRTFGWAAVLGEIMAVSTVLLVIPALARPRRVTASEGTQQAA